MLLLDEPNAGMNPIETQELLGLIRRLREELGITIVLVAHDIPLVMNLCDRIQVLNYGKLIAEGDPAAVRVQPGRHRRVPRQGARCLSSTDIHVHYGNIRALQGVSLSVAEGELVALIGSNGAGKTTTLRTISGINRVSEGAIRFEGADITRAPADRIVVARDLALPGGAPHLRQPDRAREPAAGRRVAGATSGRRPRTSRWCSGCSRCSASGWARPAAPCRAASSRCSRSGAR